MSEDTQFIFDARIRDLVAELDEEARACLYPQKKPLRCYPERSMTSFALQAKLVVP